MPWDREIVKVGNSLGLRLPSKIFQKTNFKEGDGVKVKVQDERTLILEKNDA